MTWCSVDAGSSAALLLYMQQHVHKPLRRLRHDNYSTFADIFTTALLQAAATGETLLDSGNSKTARTLQKQADKDASKIFRLNQRMQVGCAGLIASSFPAFFLPNLLQARLLHSAVLAPRLHLHWAATPPSLKHSK